MPSLRLLICGVAVDPDNYTDQATFLENLQRNPRLQPYAFWPLVADSTVIVQHVCSVIVFVVCFVGIFQERVSPVAVVGWGSLLTAAGWLVWDMWQTREERELAAAAAAAAVAAVKNLDSAGTGSGQQPHQQQQQGQQQQSRLKRDYSSASMGTGLGVSGNGPGPGYGNVNGQHHVPDTPSNLSTYATTSPASSMSNLAHHAETAPGRMSPTMVRPRHSPAPSTSSLHSAASSSVHLPSLNRDHSALSLSRMTSGVSTANGTATTTATTRTNSNNQHWRTSRPPSTATALSPSPPSPVLRAALAAVNATKQHGPSRAHLRLGTIKSAVLIYFTLLGLSPILKSLTRSTSSDSIWAMSFWLLAVNIFFFDYSTENHRGGSGSTGSGGATAVNSPPMSSHPSVAHLTQLASSSSQPQSENAAETAASAAAAATVRAGRMTSRGRRHFPASLSTNAALMASTVLASRLPSTGQVFSLTLFSIEVFGLFPVFRRAARRASWRVHVALTTALVVGAGGGVGIVVLGDGRDDDGGRWIRNALVGVIVGALVAAVAMGGCSWWLIGLQKYKNEIYGPWDQARPVIMSRRHWDDD